MTFVHKLPAVTSFPSPTRFPQFNGLTGWPARITDISQLATGLLLDLDARYGVTLAGSDVSAWADQAGAANNFSEATNRPVYTAADSNWGGRPSIAYTAANTDRLVSGDTAATWKFLHDGTGMAIGYVYRPTLSGANGRIINTLTNIGGAEIGAHCQYNGTLQRADVSINNGTSALSASSGNVSVPRSTKHSIVATYKSSEALPLALYIDGSLGAGNSNAYTPSASNPTATARIGLNPSAGGAFGGDIVAVHIWTRYFTAYDADLYHQWARAAWGV